MTTRAHRDGAKTRRSPRNRLHSSICIAAGLLAIATMAHAQMTAPANANFFGDDPAPPSSARDARRGPSTEEAVPGYEQLIVFNDGRQLRGQLLEINKDDIVWQRKDAGAPLRFPRIEVRRILTDSVAQSETNRGGNFFGRFFRRNGAASTNASSAASQATLKLPGGDWLFGQTSSADGQNFDVQLKDGTKLTVARPQIDWLYFGSTAMPAFGYSGSALDMEGWLPPSASLRVDDKALEVDGATWIGRRVNGAKRLEITFELPQDSEEGTRLWVQPFGPQPNCYGTGTAELRFGRKQISRLLYYEKFERKNSDVPKEETDKGGPTKYRVFFDAVEKRVVVWRNGLPAGDWKFIENKEDVVRGNNGDIQINGICFDREDRGQSGKPLKFNALRVEPWDGTLPKESETPGEQDRLAGAEGLPAFGKLESIEPKKLVFAGAERPLQEGIFVRLSKTDSPLTDADAKVEFGEQGEFSARNIGAKDGKLHCETTFAHTLELPLRSLQKITFKSTAVAGVAESDMLIFKNGDELTGKALAVNSPGQIRWQTAAGQEVEFHPERIAGIRFGSGGEKKDAKPAGDAALLELRTGERWRGKLLALDDKQLHLEHPLLGTVAIDRKNVWHLFPNPDLEICEGGQQPAQWCIQKPDNANSKRIARAPSAERWIYLDGNYVLRSDDANSNYNSAERPGLTHAISPSLDRFEVRVEARSSGQYPANFILNLNEKNGASLNATVSYSELELMVINPKVRGQNRWREIPFEEKIGPSNGMRALRVFVDTKAGTCDIALNGVILTRLGQVEGERLPKGAYNIRIQPYSSQNGPIVLSNVWIGPWNGDLPFTANQGEGATMLANGDVAAGTPKLIQSGKFKITYEEAELELPLEKAYSVDFGGSLEKPEAAARIRLVDGSTVNLKSFHWDGREVTGQGLLCGDIHIPAESVAELILDPALPRVPTTVSTRKLAQKNPEDAGEKVRQ